jgi:tRNA modification GTPase
MDGSTIAAVATPPGAGAISIIRLSGPRAVPIAAAVFRAGSPTSAGGPELASGNGFGPRDLGSAEHDRPAFKSHRLYYGHVVDPIEGRILDEVLLSVMRAPRSYTREDVVEINAHGGQRAARAILELLVREGARLAEPGEFTRRAFLNGRIDLTQAEAVCDLIRARSERSREASALLLSGELRKNIKQIQMVLTESRAALEAWIDFPEDGLEPIDSKAIGRRLTEEVVDPLEALVRNSIEGRVARDGVAIAILGRPNVGKSSLMNRLLGKERSIVTEVPGTTRDVVEDSFHFQGIEFRLQDTAGLHPTPDPVEKIGMAKSLESSGRSDVVILVVEAHRPIGGDELRIREKIGPKPLIVALNKIDLWPGPGDGARLPDSWRVHSRVRLSALTGAGIDDLLAELVNGIGR